MPTATKVADKIPEKVKEEKKAHKFSYARTTRFINQESRFYCRFCGEESLIDDNHESYYEFVTCMHCNNISSLERINFLDSRYGRGAAFSFICVFDDAPEKVVIKLGVSVLNNYNRRVQQEVISYRIVLNVATGHGHILEPRKMNNKRWEEYLSPRIKRMAQEPSRNYGLIDHNVYHNMDFATFRSGCMEAAELIREKAQPYYPYPLRTLEEHLEEATSEGLDINERDIDLNTLLLYCRFPHINTFKLKELFRTDVFSKIKRKLPQLRTATNNPVKFLIKQLKLPNSKSLRQLLARDPECAHYLSIAKPHIKKTDNLLKFAQAKIDLETFKDIYYLLGDENTAVNRLLRFTQDEESNRALYDTCHMLWSIWRRDNTYIPLVSSDIHEMHDSVLEDYLKYSGAKNNIFEYSDRDYMLEDRINNYRFVLPAESFGLFWLSGQMKICVGAYEGSVKNRYCTIVAVHEAGKPVLAIEIVKNDVMQAKMKYNQPPTGELLDTLLQWIEKNRLNIKTPDIPEAKNAAA